MDLIGDIRFVFWNDSPGIHLLPLLARRAILSSDLFLVGNGHRQEYLEQGSFGNRLRFSSPLERDAMSRE